MVFKNNRFGRLRTFCDKKIPATLRMLWCRCFFCGRGGVSLGALGFFFSALCRADFPKNSCVMMVKLRRHAVDTDKRAGRENPSLIGLTIGFCEAYDNVILCRAEQIHYQIHVSRKFDCRHERKGWSFSCLAVRRSLTCRQTNGLSQRVLAFARKRIWACFAK